MRLDIWTLSRVSSDPQHTQAEDSCPAGTPSPACQTWAPPQTQSTPTLSEHCEGRRGARSGSPKLHTHQNPSSTKPHLLWSNEGRAGVLCPGKVGAASVGDQLGPSSYLCSSPQQPVYCLVPFILNTQGLTIISV